MIRNYRRTTATCLVAVFALAAACRDEAPLTAPAAQPATAALTAASAKVRARAPYIANLQLSSDYVPVNVDATPFTVTVTNPTLENYGSIYLKGELKSLTNHRSVVATAFLASCPYPNGIISPGDCTMSNYITGDTTLALGQGTYTLKVLQQQANGTMKVLDSKTVDVLLVRKVAL